MKFAHISDIHWRSLKRHEEYTIVFKKLLESLEIEKPDVIFIGGDIVHSKTQGITPELIDSLNWWFTSLAKVAPMHVILGNHDGLILNKDRQDAITPIVNALNNDRIKLYKKSGVYPLKLENSTQNFNWCVFSCFDEENWKNVKPVENEINIACFHGAVWGSKTDVDWELDGEVSLSFFDNFDFGFLGDIHKLQYLDKEKRVAYPGSTIQQNYGEDILKGYLIWEINSKHDYNSKFISIENPYPFVTIDWKGTVSDTIKFCEKVKSKSRFRIRSDNNISQAEIKLLHYYLKNDKNATEIVYQVLNSLPEEFGVNTKTIEINKSIDIRKSSARKKIISDIYSDIDDELLEKIDYVFREKLDEIPQDLTQRAENWTINNLSFNNTFSYGKDNFINFNKLSGVVGLFGNNRAGKSSIPGTIMYTLFNTSDRGSIKNQDIVNIRKGECESNINISVGTKNYDVTRKTVKKTNKKGTTSATTSLELKRNDTHENETEEQRRETDKILQSLIGTSEDFLYTSFASQGEMNTFIKEKSSARKSVLSKFLNLSIYDQLHKNSRDDFVILKNSLKNIKEENWDDIVNTKKLLIENLKNNVSLNEEKISSLRKKEIEKNIEISNLEKNVNDHSSGYSLETCEKEILFVKNKLLDCNKNYESTIKNIEESEQKLEKIKLFKSQHPIEDLNRDKEKLDNLLKKLNSYTFEKKTLSNKKKSNDIEIKILDEVPCGPEFSSCKFIKKAYEAKNDESSLNDAIKNIETSVLEINSVINKLQNQAIEEKLEKYNTVLNKEYKINVDLQRLEEKKNLYKEKSAILNNELKNLQKISSEILKNNSNNLIQDLEKLKTELNRIQDDISSLERENKENEYNKFKINSEINDVIIRKNKYQELVDKWKVYDLFSHSVSKKGIPAFLISSCLPKINKEINSILNGVTNFTIEIDEDQKNNNLNVYIDYGDSKRIIELGSGMEKMIASIAIRVALTNISSLPKSDIFIIDEGFGALDDTNIEACGRLLKSLKKYFKTILVISHVDTIKDIVDKNIEISVKGQDSYVEYR